MRITFPSGVKWFTQSNSREQPNNCLNINKLTPQGEGILAEWKKPVKIKIFIFTAVYMILQFLTPLISHRLTRTHTNFPLISHGLSQCFNRETSADGRRPFCRSTRPAKNTSIASRKIIFMCKYKTTIVFKTCLPAGHAGFPPDRSSGGKNTVGGCLRLK